MKRNEKYKLVGIHIIKYEYLGSWKNINRSDLNISNICGIISREPNIKTF